MDNIKWMIKLIRKPQLWNLINKNDQEWVKKLHESYKNTQHLSTAQIHVITNIYNRATSRRHHEKEAKRVAWQIKYSAKSTPIQSSPKIILRKK